MSAFMVSTDCMNRVITGLWQNVDFRDNYHKLFEKLKSREDFFDLSKRLYLLNQAALMQRYDDKPDSSYVQIPKFEWKLAAMVSPISCLKAIHCLSYQCAEGNVPEEPLYKWLENVGHALADQIVSKTKEYDEAGWD